MEIVSKKELIKIYPAISKNKLEWWIRQRKIPLIKVGKSIFFDLQDVRDFFNNNKINTHNN